MSLIPESKRLRPRGSSGGLQVQLPFRPRAASAARMRTASDYFLDRAGDHHLKLKLKELILCEDVAVLEALDSFDAGNGTPLQELFATGYIERRHSVLMRSRDGAGSFLTAGLNDNLRHLRVGTDGVAAAGSAPGVPWPDSPLAAPAADVVMLSDVLRSATNSRANSGVTMEDLLGGLVGGGGGHALLVDGLRWGHAGSPSDGAAAGAATAPMGSAAAGAEGGSSSNRSSVTGMVSSPFLRPLRSPGRGSGGTLSLRQLHRSSSTGSLTMEQLLPTVMEAPVRGSPLRYRGGIAGAARAAAESASAASGSGCSSATDNGSEEEEGGRGDVPAGGVTSAHLYSLPPTSLMVPASPPRPLLPLDRCADAFSADGSRMPRNSGAGPPLSHLHQTLLERDGEDSFMGSSPSSGRGRVGFPSLSAKAVGAPLTATFPDSSTNLNWADAGGSSMDGFPDHGLASSSLVTPPFASRRGGAGAAAPGAATGAGSRGAAASGGAPTRLALALPGSGSSGGGNLMLSLPVTGPTSAFPQGISPAAAAAASATTAHPLTAAGPAPPPDLLPRTAALRDPRSKRPRGPSSSLHVDHAAHAAALAAAAAAAAATPASAAAPASGDGTPLGGGHPRRPAAHSLESDAAMMTPAADASLLPADAVGSGADELSPRGGAGGSGEEEDDSQLEQEAALYYAAKAGSAGLRAAILQPRAPAVGGSSSGAAPAAQRGVVSTSAHTSRASAAAAFSPLGGQLMGTAPGPPAGAAGLVPGSTSPGPAEPSNEQLLRGFMLRNGGGDGGEPGPPGSGAEELGPARHAATGVALLRLQLGGHGLSSVRSVLPSVQQQQPPVPAPTSGSRWPFWRSSGSTPKNSGAALASTEEGADPRPSFWGSSSEAAASYSAAATGSVVVTVGGRRDKSSGAGGGRGALSRPASTGASTVVAAGGLLYTAAGDLTEGSGTSPHLSSAASPWTLLATTPESSPAQAQPPRRGGPALASLLPESLASPAFSERRNSRRGGGAPTGPREGGGARSGEESDPARPPGPPRPTLRLVRAAPVGAGGAAPPPPSVESGTAAAAPAPLRREQQPSIFGWPAPSFGGAPASDHAGAAAPHGDGAPASAAASAGSEAGLQAPSPGAAAPAVAGSVGLFGHLRSVISATGSSRRKRTVPVPVAPAQLPPPPGAQGGDGASSGHGDGLVVKPPAASSHDMLSAFGLLPSGGAGSPADGAGLFSFEPSHDATGELGGGRSSQPTRPASSSAWTPGGGHSATPGARATRSAARATAPVFGGGAASSGGYGAVSFAGSGAEDEEMDTAEGGGGEEPPGSSGWPASFAVASALPFIDYGNHMVGAYTVPARLRRVAAYLAKRATHKFSKSVTYEVRKTIADTRLRVQGRFVKLDEQYLLATFLHIV